MKNLAIIAIGFLLVVFSLTDSLGTVLNVITTGKATAGKAGGSVGTPTTPAPAKTVKA
jgi:hypothetical protein